ncbi:hypothetical protein CSUI_005834 [Cystoisospora suis]|uniref:Secreted protein n=1 Tax=Cystoisospora suis TaxID=483139 RepID=A0A2C6KWJ5_9APIC|nr:hypothetical protein CSUI_005834 [Cystoisospora suis]
MRFAGRHPGVIFFWSLFYVTPLNFCLKQHGASMYSSHSQVSIVQDQRFFREYRSSTGHLPQAVVHLEVLEMNVPSAFPAVRLISAITCLPVWRHLPKLHTAQDGVQECSQDFELLTRFTMCSYGYRKVIFQKKKPCLFWNSPCEFLDQCPPWCEWSAHVTLPE